MPIQGQSVLVRVVRFIRIFSSIRVVRVGTNPYSTETPFN